MQLGTSRRTFEALVASACCIAGCGSSSPSTASTAKVAASGSGPATAAPVDAIKSISASSYVGKFTLVEAYDFSNVSGLQTPLGKQMQYSARGRTLSGSVKSQQANRIAVMFTKPAGVSAELLEGRLFYRDGHGVVWHDGDSDAHRAQALIFDTLGLQSGFYSALHDVGYRGEQTDGGVTLHHFSGTPSLSSVTSAFTGSGLPPAILSALTLNKAVVDYFIGSDGRVRRIQSHTVVQYDLGKLSASARIPADQALTGLMLSTANLDYAVSYEPVDLKAPSDSREGSSAALFGLMDGAQGAG